MSIKHYEGSLGVFDYDDEVFEVKKDEGINLIYLHFINKNNLLSVDLPKGCINTRYMFYNCSLPEGFSLGDKFDTSNVEDMLAMFSNCRLPKGFSLGDKFDTSSVKYMESMFYNCIIPEGFSLGNKFDTSNVEDMHAMFSNCNLAEGFSLGNKFSTSNVKDMGFMFEKCSLPEGFSLSDKFDTSNVKDMEYMFSNCSLPKGFSLGDKFDTSNVKGMYAMFYNCSLPEGFSLGGKFDTSNVENMYAMFSNCSLPEGFSLGGKFNISNVKYMECMFKDCILPKDFNISSFDLKTKEGIEKLIKSFNECSEGYSSKDLEACTRDLIKLLKVGKTMEESKKILAETYSYPVETISSCIVNVNAKFSDKCVEALENLLKIDYGKTYSNYSLGEVRQILTVKGYPRDIVNECIVTYLGSQHLV